jgi:peptidoglycan hydrolase-like protein with peptidoglycan-binding domain
MRKILIPILAVFAICTFFAVANAQVTQTPAFNYDLRLGSSGAEVANLQTWLIQNRFSIPAITSGAALKGYFGIQTRNAVTAFQNSVGLPAVGYFDAQTRAFINKNYTQQTPPGTLKVTSPNGNETWQKGTTQKISWTLSAPIYGVGTIRLLPYVPPCAEPTAPVRCLIAVHAPYIVASDASLQNGYYLWTVANAVETGSPLSSFANIPDGQYKIQVCSANDTFCDTSDNYFNITSNSGGGTGPLQVTSPNGGEYWKTDTIEQIRWTSPQYFRAAYVDIKLIRTMPPCTGICPMYAFAPYRIVNTRSRSASRARAFVTAAIRRSIFIADLTLEVRRP